MHPAKDIQGSLSDYLQGKRIVLGITGSIGAVECVKLARALIRHGAEVIPVMTKAATRIITPDAMWFACGTPPIIELTGAVEHVDFCGERDDMVDLLLIAPATANTISKIACGIDDTPVTTFATSALGSKIPIMVAPAMHATMINNPFVTENLERLRKAGIDIPRSREEEHSIKLLDLDTVVDSVINRIGPRDFHKYDVLVIAGATTEPVDDMRMLTNKSTGLTGIELARNAFIRGANVTLLLGHHTAQEPPYMPVEYFTTTNDLLKKATKHRSDIMISCAAVSDYSPKKHEGKIPSGEDTLTLTFRPMPKVIAHLRKKWPKAFLVGFKAESRITQKELLKRAQKRMADVSADLMVANDLKNVSETETIVNILHKDGSHVDVEGKKRHVAQKIMDEIRRALNTP